MFYIFKNGTLHFLVQAQKIKEIHPRKISYTLRNRNPPKSCYISYILENGTFESKA